MLRRPPNKLERVTLESKSAGGQRPLESHQKKNEEKLEIYISRTITEELIRGFWIIKQIVDLQDEEEVFV